MRDVIVIGARCGGAPTAMLLARKGYDVLLIDRARFPSDIAHGHLIHRHGPSRLAKWGLLDRIAATGCPPIESVCSDYGDFELWASGLNLDGIALAYAPRRAALDNVLVQAAVEAGAELREEFTVESLSTDSDRVTGIRGRDRKSGAVASERARITIGADGRGSMLARRMRAPLYEAVPSLTFCYFSYWSGMASNALEVHAHRDHAIFGFPTNDGAYGVFIFWPMSAAATVRADVERHFMAAVDRVPDFSEHLRAARRVERFHAALDLPNFLRKPYGPGWALVGDAGCHKDPFLALGISDAFRDAELLCEAVDDMLSGRSAMEEAMADYERRRNEATLPDYRRNLELASFAPLPVELLRIRTAVRHDPDLCRQFVLANLGAVPRETFFNPENLQRLFAGAA